MASRAISMRRVPPLAYGRYVLTKLLARVKHAIRSCVPKRVSISFIGGYHGENTGVWAMVEALLAEASRSGVTSRRLAMRDALKLCNMSGSLVIGGGAVATADALEPIAAIWSEKHFPVNFVGVDFGMNLHEFSPMIRDMCHSATSIGLRHESQLLRVQDWSGNPNTFTHADVAFARPMPSMRQRSDCLVAINVLPLFHTLSGNKFQLGSFLEGFYRSNDSQLADNIALVGEQYVEFISGAVDRFIAEGYEIIHLPFAPEDDAFARAILPKKVTYANFTADLSKLERIVASASFFLPTRFHALIAGIRTQTPIIPLAYSAKSEALLQEFGIKRNQIINRTSLCVGDRRVHTIKVAGSSVLSAASLSSSRAITSAVSQASTAR